MESEGRSWILIALLVALGVGIAILGIRAYEQAREREVMAMQMDAYAQDMQILIQEQQAEIERLRAELERARGEARSGEVAPVGR